MGFCTITNGVKLFISGIIYDSVLLELHNVSYENSAIISSSLSIVPEPYFAICKRSSSIVFTFEGFDLEKKLSA